MGIWNEFAAELRKRTLNEDKITMTVDEIIRATGTTDRSVREPGWWSQCARGAEAYRAFANENIALNYECHDGQVSQVTFWHSLFPPESRQTS